MKMRLFVYSVAALLDGRLLPIDILTTGGLIGFRRVDYQGGRKRAITKASSYTTAITSCRRGAAEWPSSDAALRL